MTLALLRSAEGRDIPPPLGRILDTARPLEEVVRRLHRYGLVKVDDQGQQIQVHRLVQLIVRDALTEEARRQAYASAHRLLATANPGDPDNPAMWDLHAKIGPHIVPSRLIEEHDAGTRQAVLDQIRYLQVVGDYDGSHRLASRQWTAWTGHGDDEQVFLCERHLVATPARVGRLRTRLGHRQPCLASG